MSDFSPLRESKLIAVFGEFKPERDAEILRSIKTLETDQRQTGGGVLEGSGRARPQPIDDAWLKQVAALPAEKQVEAVAAKLKELNPGFDGKVTPTIDRRHGDGLEFVTDDVTDISPVRALAGLKDPRIAAEAIPGRAGLRTCRR